MNKKEWCYDCWHGSHQKCKGYIGWKKYNVPCKCEECFIPIEQKPRPKQELNQWIAPLTVIK